MQRILFWSKNAALPSRQLSTTVHSVSQGKTPSQAVDLSKSFLPLLQQQGLKDSLSLPVVNPVYKSVVSSIAVHPNVFNGPVRVDILHRNVHWFLAKQRAGTASTLTRAEVSGGGKKPYKQKGTGNARSGSTRAPHRRHGGVVFGPKPRDWSYRLPTKVFEFGIRTAMAARFGDGKLVVWDTEKLLQETQTKVIGTIVEENKWKSVLIVVEDDQQFEAIFRIARNIPYCTVLLRKQLTAYDIIKHSALVITKDCALSLSEKLKPKIKLSAVPQAITASTSSKL